MQILAINTATESCSVALWNDGAIYRHFEICHLEHNKRILPLIQKILNQGNVVLNQVSVLAFSRGPGSFTGVRIGVGIAQGLAMGIMIPIIGVSTLETMAQGAWRKTGVTQVLASIDARMGEVYWAEYIRDKYGVWHGKETETILKINAMNKRITQLSGKWATVGTGWNICPKITTTSSSALNLVDGCIPFPEAEDMLPIAYHLFVTGQSVSVEYAEPTYLRNETMWKKINRK